MEPEHLHRLPLEAQILLNDDGICCGIIAAFLGVAGVLVGLMALILRNLHR